MSISVSAESSHAIPPAEPDVTPEELIRRATALVPILVEQQAETEQRTFYSERTHQAFLNAGLYQVTQPRRYGGYGFGVSTFAQITAALARGCPSTAWCWAFGLGHTIAMAAYWNEKAQDDVFRDGLFICPSTGQPSGAAKKVDGGWIINGIFRYSSGAPYATHFWGHAMPETADGSSPAPMSFVIEAGQFERLDDWGGTLGLRGSGSHSLKIVDGFVPDHRVMLNTTFLTLRPEADGTTVGSRLYDDPLYANSAIRWFLMEILAVAAGTVRGAQDEYANLLRSQAAPFPPPMPRKEHPDYQRWYGEGVGKVAALEAILRDACRQIDVGGTDGTLSMADDLRIVRMAFEGLQLGWDALQKSFVRTAGSSQLRADARMERIWRDYSQMHTHAVNLMADAIARDVALEEFDVAPTVPGSIRPAAPADQEGDR
jgi:3-hydroxy-9,10-secoandrosta-1,3,5(10)-triene-9,17-dione monooxygenase